MFGFNVFHHMMIDENRKEISMRDELTKQLSILNESYMEQHEIAIELKKQVMHFERLIEDCAGRMSDIIVAIQETKNKISELTKTNEDIGMDKAIKKLQKSTKKVVKEEASLLKVDKKHDKFIKNVKKMKKKC